MTITSDSSKTVSSLLSLQADPLRYPVKCTSALSSEQALTRLIAIPGRNAAAKKVFLLCQSFQLPNLLRLCCPNAVVAMVMTMLTTTTTTTTTAMMINSLIKTARSTLTILEQQQHQAHEFKQGWLNTTSSEKNTTTKTAHWTPKRGKEQKFGWTWA